MDRKDLYDSIANRKIKPKDFNTYDGNNGRVNKCVQLIKSGIIRSSGKIVDVGCGIGDLGFSVKDLFDVRYATDITETNLEAAKSKGNETYLCDVDKQGLNFLENNSVDVVVALDFIEHIIDPEYFARECCRVLKSGGQVFINTPNIQYYEHLDSQLKGNFPHTSGDGEVFHGGHLAFYNFNDMNKIFGQCGFKNMKQIKDEEGYKTPPDMFIKFLNPKNQQDYIDCCMRLGNPNLLFLCEKP